MPSGRKYETHRTQDILKAAAEGNVTKYINSLLKH